MLFSAIHQLESVTGIHMSLPSWTPFPSHSHPTPYAVTEHWVVGLCQTANSQLLSIYMCCLPCLVAQSCLTLCDPMDCSPPGFFVHGDSPGKNTGVGCHALLQGIFPTQGLNPAILHGRRILYHVRHRGSPSILHVVVYIFPCYWLNSSHTLLPPLRPQVCSLCLCLHCCPANRFIGTIFLDSIRMHSWMRQTILRILTSIWNSEEKLGERTIVTGKDKV